MRQLLRTRHWFMAGCFVAGIGAAWAQNAPNPAVDAIFADLTKPGSPGCALGVYRDGTIIYARGYGLANLEETVPITPQSVFDIGSISKQFTAASVLLLERQGKLRLDDDIRKYIPELPDYSQQGGQPITLLQLLNHTSGLRDYVSLFLLAGIHFDNVTTDNDALGMITRQRGLNFPPGSDWEYSGSGYFLLSLVVKRVSGKSLKEFAQDNIFRPLAMRHTQYRDDHTSLIPHRVLAYDRDEKGVYTLSVSYAETTGDGMVQSSIEDMQKWDENFYSGQVGGKGFVAEMEVPAKLNKGVTVDYAKGLFLDEYRGLRMIWHSGGSGGYRALLSRFPEQHLSIACLCNLQTVNRSKRVRAVAETYLSEKMKPKLDTFAGKLTPRQTGPMEFELEDPTILKVTFEPPRMGAAGKLMVFRFLNFSATFEAIEEVKPTAAELATYAGDYWSDELRVTYRLMMQNGSLWMKALIGADGIVHTGTVPFSEMRPALRDEFVLSEAPLIFSFTRDAQHSLTGFTLNGFLEHGMLFARLRDKN